MLERVAQKMGMVTLKDYKELQQSMVDLQIVLADIQSVGSTATGNPYKNYRNAVVELGKKYEGMADWGCYQARSIVDVRSAFTIGNGIQVVERDPVTKRSRPDQRGKFKKEIEFIEQFIENNDIDEEGAQEYAKEAELEGRVLFRLIPNSETKQIDLRFLSYSHYDYEVIPNPEDYKVYESVEYKINGGNQVILKKGQFVYKKFAGRTNKVNDIMPKTATVLRVLEDLDKALNDLRKINNLFASPTPWFNCEDETSARNLYQTLKDINWKIGKFITTAKAQFAMVGADASGVESIVKEITNCVKIISGVTGIPVHFLGLPDLMSNRSTSTDMFELIVASTNKERKTWIGTWEEVFKLAMQMSNDTFGTTFNTEAVSCDIPHITSAKLKELVEIWLPLFSQNVIDLDFMLSMIPDADPDRIKKANAEAAKQMLDLMKSRETQDPNEPEEPNEQ